MHRNFLENAKGVISVCIYVANTLFWAVPIYLAAIAKLLIPQKTFRKYCDIVLNTSAGTWVWLNNLTQRVFCDIRWHVTGTESLKNGDWYLVVSNHQSWTDILVLQRIFHGKIPFLKFFIKAQLFWLPVIGQIWWALDFPFMKRYSSEFLRRNPHLKGRDLETTIRACEKFKSIPVSVMNFAEGTRFTPQKHKRQNSPFTHLLKPKAGGMAFSLAAMGEHLHCFIDVTIAYPGERKSFWDFLCGRVQDIRVQVRSLPITQDMLGDYYNDAVFRQTFQDWVNALWIQKDTCIQEMISTPEPKALTKPLSFPPFHTSFPASKNDMVRE